MQNEDYRENFNQSVELDGQDSPEVAWLDYNGLYVANPFYTGPKVRHPEDSTEEDYKEWEREPTEEEKAEHLQVKFEDLEEQEYLETHEEDWHTGEWVKKVTAFEESQIRRKYAKLRTDLMLKFN